MMTRASHHGSAKDLKSRLLSGSTLWATGIYDALSARLAEQAGFDVVMTGGYSMTASLLGQPDAELITLTENATIVRNAAAAIDIPLIADIDTGYGNAINVQRTIDELIRAGASGVILEDQVSPKRCPVCVDSVSVIPLDEAIGKVEAANEARQGSDLVLVARTDASTEEDAIRRAKAYVAAGADLIQPISRTFRDFQGLKRLRDACEVPLSLQLLGWLERDLSAEQVQSIAALATYPLVAILTVAKALSQNLAALRKSDGRAHLPLPVMDILEFNRFIGVPALEERQRRYLRGEEN